MIWIGVVALGLLVVIALGLMVVISALESANRKLAILAEWCEWNRLVVGNAVELAKKTSAAQAELERAWTPWKIS